MYIKVNTNINIGGKLYKAGSNYEVDDATANELLSSKCAVECKVTEETTVIGKDGKGNTHPPVSMISVFPQNKSFSSLKIFREIS